jgi:hypothetical protein
VWRTSAFIVLNERVKKERCQWEINSILLKITNEDWL